jgi:CheY-like chemotaxis protein
MPKINGFEFARRIRAQPWGKKILIYALTGCDRKEHFVQSREAGINHHLIKPLEIDALVDSGISSHFRASRYRRSAGSQCIRELRRLLFENILIRTRVFAGGDVYIYIACRPGTDDDRDSGMTGLSCHPESLPLEIFSLPIDAVLM